MWVTLKSIIKIIFTVKKAFGKVIMSLCVLLRNVISAV